MPRPAAVEPPSVRGRGAPAPALPPTTAPRRCGFQGLEAVRAERGVTRSKPRCAGREAAAGSVPPGKGWSLGIGEPRVPLPGDT